MNKAELIEMIAQKSQMSKASAKKALDAFLETVEQTLKKKKSVVLTGFGTFTVVKRKGRMGINPVTGEKMRIPAKHVVKFRVGKSLKDSVAK